MKRLIWTLVGISLLVGAIWATPASAAFGLKDLDVTFTAADGTPSMQAGSHPFAMTTSLDVNTAKPEPGVEVPEGGVRDLIVNLPPGFVGTPNPVPNCSTADFLNSEDGYPSCPDASAVGVALTRMTLLAPSPQTLYSPVYNLKPPPGVAAKFGFIALALPVTFEVGVSPSPPYNLAARVTNITEAALFYGSDLTLWGNPADSAHDPLRGRCLDLLAGLPEPTSLGDCPVSLPQKPFLTLPRSCTGPLTAGFEAVAWNTGERNTGTATTHDGSVPPNPLGMSGCSKLGFSPRISAQPTNRSAESPTGLDFGLEIEDEGLLDPKGVAHSDIRKAVVTLPKGMTVNPSQAEGLETCSEADLARESANSQFGAGCPGAAKIGTVEVETPLLEGTLLKGSVFVATPYENPFDSLIALYMTIKDPERGINVALAGKVEPDPRTGQLITTFDDLPQLPFSHFRFHFREGGRSPLVTPPLCGTYETRAVFTPWANPDAPYTTTSSFNVGSGPGGGPCPSGAVPPFKPGFDAGSINNNAGSYSPFYMRLTRADGEQDMTKFSSILPPGVTGKIAGVLRCPDAAIAAASGKSGHEELAAPSCPPGSRIGRTMVGAGVGSQLTYVPGHIYLAGPYKGAPLSVVAITPAVAGPFDVGTVVVREGLALNRETAEVEVDGAASDPIPHILAGIPLKLRDLRIYVDRSNFTLNPTSCDPAATRATLFGSFADVFNPADDVPTALSERYQAANCSALAFGPRLSLALKGGTKRAAYPALRAVLKARPGDANIGKAVVTLPHSVFLEQAHIRTICTRVQFTAGQCPKGSIYGRARAITPLLDEPLEGPVYLRSSNHPLPDIVAALHGVVDIDLVGRLDSIDAQIRSSFESTPDAPVNKFTLEMQGGKKGLLVNSRNLCAHKSRAIAAFTGQNGKPHEFKPVLKANCGKARKK
jgi:hypothetical protein